jgi:DNA-binding PadR family transcriptional regulator
MREDRKYAITDKGRQFLTLYNETNRLLTTLGDEGIIAAYNLQVQNQGQLHEQQQQEQREVALHKQLQ